MARFCSSKDFAAEIRLGFTSCTQGQKISFSFDFLEGHFFSDNKLYERFSKPREQNHANLTFYLNLFTILHPWKELQIQIKSLVCVILFCWFGEPQ